MNHTLHITMEDTMFCYKITAQLDNTHLDLRFTEYMASLLLAFASGQFSFKLTKNCLANCFNCNCVNWQLFGLNKI